MERDIDQEKIKDLSIITISYKEACNGMATIQIGWVNNGPEQEDKEANSNIQLQMSSKMESKV